jgi:predicted ATP-grasp superfamily ATP-dependent carboligase
VVKSPVSTGGLGVELWKGDAVSADCHLQEYVPGPSLASVFLLTPSGAHLVGTTRQILARDLLGEAFVPREPFRYVGSVGPEIVTTTERVVLERLGRCLQGAFGLRGLVGVDWVRSSQGVSIIEVNPRYTASIEILERAADQPLFGHHAAAFDAAIPVGPLPTIETTGRWGKLVLYAPSSGRLDASAPCFADDHCFADIPTIATCHPAGQPILTLLARVPKDGDPLAELCRKASDFLARHFVSTGEEPRCTP